jgi:hypothetical protein
MKLTCYFASAFVGAFASQICAVQAETMLRVIFNNGIADPSLSCSAQDNLLVSRVFERPLNRRNLRSSATSDQMARSPIDYIQEIKQSNGNGEDRELQAPAHCKEDCRGYVTGQCRAIGCASYNKNRRLNKYGQGFLSNSTYCRTTADSIESDLQYLVNQNMVSRSCIALLQAPRKIECYEDVMYGIVEAFKVIDADSDTELVSFLHAKRTICNIKAFNFQVTVNDCVNSLNITLYNEKAGYRRSVVRDTTVPGPYTVFGMVGTSKENFHGVSLPLGNYTIEATPDGNPSKTRERNFFIAQC